jgi:imidazolonepropionase
MMQNTFSATLIGPFDQLLTMRELPMKGALKDEQLEIVKNGGIVVNGGVVTEIGDFITLSKTIKNVEEVSANHIAMPAFVDSHTHICFAGSRAKDYTARLAGKTYQQILQAGGGIHDTVRATRAASQQELLANILSRLDRMQAEGVTTCEIKSGYGLTIEEELKMLRAIKQASDSHSTSIVATCLAAHVPDSIFSNASEYLKEVAIPLFELIQKEGLSSRIDAFVEPEAFPVDISLAYLRVARNQGFDITVHADQFTSGGSKVAIDLLARSTDHLEAISDVDIELLAKSTVVATVLPGASLGLGIPFSPARKLLNAGCCLAIASDWNPGSAPMGSLLTQAALMSAYEHLTNAEVFAGITFRAAKALGLTDRGVLAEGKLADIIAFPTSDFRDVLYNQGQMRPSQIWKNGTKI